MSTFIQFKAKAHQWGSSSVFVRLQGCNLDCGASGGDWRCDTEAVWKRGEKHDIGSLFNQIINNYQSAFKLGSHLIITGGEPLLQQHALIEWLSLFKIKPFVELKPMAPLFQRIDWMPSLTNGMHPKVVQ